jgi:hypothetical protein
MLKSKKPVELQPPDLSEEVVILADAVGGAQIALAQVVEDLFAVVSEPILAGGFAMAHYGLLRATADIDVLAVDSVQAALKSLSGLGYRQETLQIKIGMLQLLTKGNKGIDFLILSNTKLRNSMRARAVPGTFMGRPVCFVSLEDLILLKIFAVDGRKSKIDEVDLESLLKKPHDRVYVNRWRNELAR